MTALGRVQNTLEQAREMAARQFGDADYFSLDLADANQLRYAAIFERFLKEQMRAHRYIYVPLHSSHRRRHGSRAPAAIVEIEKQKLMFIYDPPREKQPRDEKGNVIPDLAPPPLKKMTERQQHKDIQRQMMKIDRAFFVRRDSGAGTCHVTVLNRNLFAQALTFLGTQAYYDVTQPRPWRIDLVSALMSFLRSPSTCFLQDMMFAQLPSIVTSFALNLPHLRQLCALLPETAGMPLVAPPECTRAATYEAGDVDIVKLASVTAATSMLNSADASDDEDDGGDDSSNSSSRSSGTQTPATGAEFEAMAHNDLLLASLNTVANDARRSGMQQHPFFDQLCDSDWIMTRLCWFVAGFKYVFMNEADCSLGAKWSHADLFYFLNQLQAHVEERPHLTSNRRRMGNARLFFREQARVNATLPSDLRQAAQAFVTKMRDKVFVNDAKTPEIVCERLTRGLTEALYSSSEIYECVGEAFAKVQFIELINRFQIRSTHRQRFDNAVAMPCTLIGKKNVNAEVLEFVDKHGLLFEERRLKQLVAQSPNDNCLDVVCKLHFIDNNMTPLALVSSIREVCPTARTGIDFLLLYTPLSAMKTTEHEYHRERQRVSPPYTMRSLDEDVAHYRANHTTYTPVMGNLYGAEAPAVSEAAPKRKLHASKTVGPEHCLLLMKQSVWRAVSDATYAAILIQRSRSSNEYSKAARQNDFVPLCAPLAARAVCRIDCSDETRCETLNAFSSLCGGSKCEWTAGTPRADMFAKRVTDLVVRICDVEIEGDAQSLIKVIVAPLCTHLRSIECTGEISARQTEDAGYSSFYSLMQLVLNGNVLSIACCNEQQWIDLQRLTQNSVFWIEYLRDCYLWHNDDNNTTMPPPAPLRVGDTYDDDETDERHKCMCECGGAQQEECDLMFKQRSPFCCVCLYNNNCNSNTSTSRRYDEKVRADALRMNLCEYCRDRIPYRGASRPLAPGIATYHNSTTIGMAPSRVFMTLFDSSDNRRPMRASIIELAEYLLDCADKGEFTHGEALALLSSFRFNLQGYPSRVAVPRGRLNRSSKRREIYANLAAYAKRLEVEEENSDIPDMNTHTASRDEFNGSIADSQLREILQKTSTVRQWSRKSTAAAKSTPADEAPLDDRQCLSLTLVMTCLEIISLSALRALLQFASVYERLTSSSFGGDEHESRKAVCELRALLQLLAPLRSVDEMRTYTSNIDRTFPLVPLCKSALAEATMFDKRSMTTLASSHKVPLEATLDNMLYNKTTERPAALAVQGMLEFLFVNSCNLDRAPRQRVVVSVPPAALAQQENDDDNDDRNEVPEAQEKEDEDADIDDKQQGSSGSKKLRHTIND